MEPKIVMKYYAVHSGRRTGVFSSWDEMKHYVQGFKGAKFKKFSTQEEADYYVQHGKCMPMKESPHPGFRDHRDIMIFTDGAASSKTKRSAIGIIFSDTWYPFNYQEELPLGTTNQYAELYAIAKAVEILSTSILPKSIVLSVELWTDSRYAVNALTFWGDRWERNGWLTSEKTPVKYRKIIEETRNLIHSISPNEIFSIHHISEVQLSSHDPEPRDGNVMKHIIWKGNKDADKLASSLIQS